jgi:formyl-CoA transferase
MPAVFDDPNVAERNMVRSFPVGDTTVRAVGNAIKIAGEVEPDPTPPPALGADTDTVLRSLLGYDDAMMQRLREAGVFGDTVMAGTTTYEGDR